MLNFVPIRSAYPSAYAAKAIEQYKEKKAQSTSNAFMSTIPQMPKKLPHIIEDFLSEIPENMHPSVAMTIFPGLMAHFTDTVFHYSDNRTWHPNCMVVCIVEQSSGKGSVKLLVDYIMADIKASDAPNRQKENEWKEKNQQRGANAEKPARPKDIPIQWIDSNCTEARFCKDRRYPLFTAQKSSSRRHRLSRIKLHNGYLSREEG